jgi:hypothetical protein
MELFAKFRKGFSPKVRQEALRLAHPYVALDAYTQGTLVLPVAGGEESHNGKETHPNVASEGGRMVAHQRSSNVRLFALVFALVVGLAIALGAMLSGAQAQAASQYTFTKVADSAEDGFNPFSFECSAINNRGDIAFRTAREPRRGSQLIQGIYRANANGKKLTTIAEFGGGFDFLGQIPSINDEGQVSFAVREFSERDFVETQSVMRGSGKKPTTIASTADEFNRFGFEPTVNNDGVVAFKAELDNIDTFDFENGMFSGQDGKRANITTHYLSSSSQFSEFGALSRPSINNLGEIAFEEQVDEVFASGIFVTEEGGFKTIAEPDPNVNVGRPNLNDAGTVAFHRFFNDRAGEELVSGNGGQLTVLADTSGPFQSFGFFFGFTPPALNNNGDVAFFAELDSGGSGIFVGPDPVADRVIGTGDTLDGSTVRDLRFCDEGLNDSGQLAFEATFDDPSVPEGRRVSIYRATPAP